MAALVNGVDAPTTNGTVVNARPVPETNGVPAVYTTQATDEYGYSPPDADMGTRRKLRVVLMGMGASGIDFAYHSKTLLQDVELQIYEKNVGLGGTWFENRYPGCACDIPSVGYQYTWELKPDWSHYYSGSPEICKYMEDTVEKHGLGKFVKFSHKIVEADWLEDEGKWKLIIMRGDDPTNTITDYADFFIHGGGVLNNWKWPTVPGLKDFEGELIHSARYDSQQKLEGKRVCVIGAGSTGMQIIPKIVDEVSSLYCFIRSPTWATPGFAQSFAGPGGANFPYSEEMKKKFAEDHDYYVRYCKAVESELCTLHPMFLNGSPSSKAAQEFSVNQMKQKLQGHPELADFIIPSDFPIGCRRPTPGNGFLEGLVHEKTTVFTEQIAAITPKGFRRADGTEYEVDVIICATGFDTSFKPQFPIRAHGKNLQDMYAKEVVSYMGLGAPEVPNYFVYLGPYGPIAQGSVMPLVEFYTKYFIQVINKVQVDYIKEIQPSMAASRDFVQHADLYLKNTAWAAPCPSWYKNGSRKNKPLVWPGSRVLSLTALSTPRFEDYEIKYLYSNRFCWLGNGFDSREHDGRDVTYYFGTIDGKDEQPKDFNLGKVTGW